MGGDRKPSIRVLAIFFIASFLTFAVFSASTAETRRFTQLFTFNAWGTQIPIEVTAEVRTLDSGDVRSSELVIQVLPNLPDGTDSGVNVIGFADILLLLQNSQGSFEVQDTQVHYAEPNGDR